MSMNAAGINLESLKEAFLGSEDVLVQMLSLFLVQSRERREQLNEHLAAWRPEAARTVLHSLVNISGAVRAYGMSELSKAVGDAVKRDDPATARGLAKALEGEAGLVQQQAQAMLDAAAAAPVNIWEARLPGS